MGHSLLRNNFDLFLTRKDIHGANPWVGEIGRWKFSVIEAILAEVVIAQGPMGLREPQTPPNMVLQSMIVVDYEGSIDKLAGHFDVVSGLLDEKISIEGHHQLRAIEFAIDPATLPRRIAHLNPTVFRLERRLNTEYSSNRFYSFANTFTENHLSILEKLEDLISN